MARAIDPNLVTQLQNDINSMMMQLAAFAADPGDPEDAGAVRKVRVMSAGLSAVSDQIGRFPPPVMGIQSD